MNGPSGERVTEWAGGSLSELMSALLEAALPARIRVFAPGARGEPAGEVHLLAGGLADAFAGADRGQEAVAVLQRVTGARFVIDTRLPDPETGSLAKPGPAEGNLAQRPLAELMRYCEQYVLTCRLEVGRGEEQAQISYRRGELVGTTVGGSDAPERLPEVMGWKEGFFKIDLPLPVTPRVPAPSRRYTPSAPVVGPGVGMGSARPLSGERARRATDPFIPIDTTKGNLPAWPAGALRPKGEGSPKLPLRSPLPGLQAQVATPARGVPAQDAGPRPAPSGPAPVPRFFAPPIRRATPSSASAAAAAAPARTAQAPVAAGTSPGMPAPRPLSTPAVAARGTTPPRAPAAPAPNAREVAPTSSAAATSLPALRVPGTVRAAQAPLSAPSVTTPSARDAQAPLSAPSVTTPTARAAQAPLSAPSVATPSARAAQAPLSAPSVATPSARAARAPAPSVTTPTARAAQAPLSAPSVATPSARAAQAPLSAPSVATPAAHAAQAPLSAPSVGTTTVRAAQAPLSAPPVAAPTADDAREVTASSNAPVPSLVAKPSDAQQPARPMSPLVPEPAATSPNLLDGSAAAPPQFAPPTSAPSGVPTAPVERTTPSPAALPPTPTASTALEPEPYAAPHPRPSAPPASPSADAIRGALATAAHSAPSALNRTSGEIVQPSTPPRGSEARPSLVELSEDMQDPAAFVDTPPPEPVVAANLAQPTPKLLPPPTRRVDPPTVRLVAFAADQRESRAVDREDPRSGSGKPRARRGVGDWPLLVHVVLGVVLGVAIVVAYSSYYGLPLP